MNPPNRAAPSTGKHVEVDRNKCGGGRSSRSSCLTDMDGGLPKWPSIPSRRWQRAQVPAWPAAYRPAKVTLLSVNIAVTSILAAHVAKQPSVPSWASVPRSRVWIPPGEVKVRSQSPSPHVEKKKKIFQAYKAFLSKIPQNWSKNEGSYPRKLTSTPVFSGSTNTHVSFS